MLSVAGVTHGDSNNARAPVTDEFLRASVEYGLASDGFGTGAIYLKMSAGTQKAQEHDLLIDRLTKRCSTR